MRECWCEIERLIIEWSLKFCLKKPDVKYLTESFLENHWKIFAVHSIVPHLVIYPTIDYLVIHHANRSKKIAKMLAGF